MPAGFPQYRSKYNFEPSRDQHTFWTYPSSEPRVSSVQLSVPTFMTPTSGVLPSASAMNASSCPSGEMRGLMDTRGPPSRVPVQTRAAGVRDRSQRAPATRPDRSANALRIAAVTGGDFGRGGATPDV